MIKLKSLLFEQEERKIHPFVSNWKNEKAQKYASILIEKYGEPKIKGKKMLLWEDLELIDEESYEYKVKKIDKVYIIDESIAHSFPAKHTDYVYSTLKIPQIQAKDGVSTIKPELVGKFAGGTSGKKRGYAKCVPKSKAGSMSKKEKESATRRKRAAQNKKGRGGTSDLRGGGKKPIRVSTKPKK